MGQRLIPKALTERIRELPLKPGVYFFKDGAGKPLYVGKALSIRKRVMGHFHRYGETVSKEGLLLSQTVRIDFIETATEAEALLLESSLIKDLAPKYNSELKDDKSYPYLKITAEEYPRLLVVRGRKADGAQYFGPYTSAYLLRQAVRMLRVQFPMRTCRKFPKKVCLLYHLGQCGGPCEELQSSADYKATVKELENFLHGRRDSLVKNLLKRMKESSAAHDYEKAKMYYQEVRALSSLPVLRPKAERGAEVLKALQEALHLPCLPRKIECFDISNIQGHEAVGAMTVFVDGEPAKESYRRFRIKTVRGIDDTRMMQEMLRRRYGRMLEENSLRPDLVLIDGGRGHLSAAKAVMKELSLDDLPVISIAKEHEYIFSTDRDRPHVFPPGTPFLELLRHLRDEAHRFAISYYRRLHRRKTLLSRLDGIPGVGPRTKERLLRKAGTVDKIQALDAESLAGKTGLSTGICRKVLQGLR